MANSHSADGVIEGMEWADKTDKPWLLTVQWHPERMVDKDSNPFSKNVREAFIAAVRANTV
jgi:putative glutamine amidotransferase